MHDSAHDDVSLAVFDDFVVLLATSSLGLFLLLVALHILTRADFFGRERSCHEKPAIVLLALGDDKGLSLFLDLFAQLFDQLLGEQLFDKKIDNLCPQNVPGVSLAFRVLHVELHEEVLEVVLLNLVHSNVDSDQTSLLALKNVQVEVILVPERA